MLRLSNDSNGSWLEQASVLSMSIRLSRDPCEALIEFAAAKDGTSGGHWGRGKKGSEDDKWGLEVIRDIEVSQHPPDRLIHYIQTYEHPVMVWACYFLVPYWSTFQHQLQERSQMHAHKSIGNLEPVTSGHTTLRQALTKLKDPTLVEQRAGVVYTGSPVGLALKSTYYN